MAAWWSGNVDRKTFFCKMHKHLKNQKKSENENMMNRLNKRERIQERIQAPTYAAEVLEPFLYLNNDSMKNQHYQQALAKKAWRKINTSTLSVTAIASASLASMSTGILIDIEQTSPILHSEQPSAKNFFCFSGQNAQSNFLQQRAPLESSISVSRKKEVHGLLQFQKRG